MNEPPAMPPPPPGTTPQPGWQAPPPPYEPGPRYSGFWRRVAALIIDGIVLIPLWIPAVVSIWGPVMDEVERSIESGTQANFTDLTGTMFGWSFVAFVGSYLYAFLMVGLWGATVGKFALAIRVRDVGGEVASWGQAAIRPALQTAVNILQFLPFVSLLGLLDYLWMLWDKQKQCLHDKMASTIVVRV